MAGKTKNTEKTKTGKEPKKGGKDAVRESLVKELRNVIPRLDTEGLAFLVEQARVHLYNMQVDELNKAAEAANAASAKAAGISRASLQRTSKSAGTGLRIDGTESGSSYYLRYRNDDVMFSREEISHLVRIINGEGTDLEIRERLYNWLDRERRDVFAVVPIKDKFDDNLKALLALFKKTFRKSRR